MVYIILLPQTSDESEVIPLLSCLLFYLIKSISFQYRIYFARKEVLYFRGR